MSYAKFVTMWGILTCSIAPTVSAQESTAALEKEYTISGYPFLVKKQSLDFDDSKDRYIGDFPTQKKAEEAKDRLNKALKGADANRWNYMVLPRTDVKADQLPPLTSKSANPGIPSKIKQPDLKMVDPGPIATALRKRLVGKRFKGVIGGVPVDFIFRDQDQLEFAGKKTGKAKWSIEADGQIVIEADDAAYFGAEEDGKLVGTRIMKAPPKAKARWNVDLGSGLDALMEPGKAYRDPTTESKANDPDKQKTTKAMPDLKREAQKEPEDNTEYTVTCINSGELKFKTQIRGKAAAIKYAQGVWNNISNFPDSSVTVEGADGTNIKTFK